MVRKIFIERAVPVFVMVSMAVWFFVQHANGLGAFFLSVAAFLVLVSWVNQLRDSDQQNQLPGAPSPSLSTRLMELDEALRAGLITQQDYEKKRADIIGAA